MLLMSPPPLFVPSLGMGELLLVLALVLLLFGPGKLPQVAQSLGEAVNRFRNGTNKIEAPSSTVLKTDFPEGAKIEMPATKNPPSEDTSTPPTP